MSNSVNSSTTLFAVIAVTLLTVISYAQSGTYSVEDLAPGTVSSSDYSYFPKKINDHGVITGLKYYLNSGSVIAQTWSGTFELPAGGPNSNGYDINKSGIVAGRGNFANFDNRAYTYSTQAQSLFWLPCPLYSQFGRACEAYAINDGGIAVGTSDPRFLYPADNGTSSRALKWDSGVVSEIFPSASFASVANDINSSGTIVGMREYQPFILSPTTGLQLLGSYGNIGALGEMVAATAINDSNHAVGLHTLNFEGLPQRSFYWNGTTAIDIGTLGLLSLPYGDSRPVVEANDINNSDQVVGHAGVGFDQNDLMVTHAFIWDPQNGMRDLNTLIPSDSGIVLTQATGINNLGEIAAIGYRVGDNPYIQRAYRLKFPIQLRNPVIFIPGTMGSEIRGEWNGFDVPFWVNLNPSPNPNLPSINNLTLDSSSNYYTEGLYASDILQTGLSGVYKPLIDSLKSHGYIPYDYSRHLLSISGCDLSQASTDSTMNPSLFVFPYDWRQDNNDTANKLKDYVQCVQNFYPAGTKIDVLAHSQGGLVARRYILQSQLQNHPHGLGRVITIASPFLGAPEANYKIYTGGNWEGLFSAFVVSPTNIKFLAPHFPSMHQLFASRQYQDFEGNIVAESGDVNGNGVPDEIYTFGQNVAQLNADFPDTTPGTVGAGFHDFPGQDDWRQDQSGISYFHIVGEQSQLDTTHGLAVKISWQCQNFGVDITLSGRCYNDRLYIPELGTGDHTVPTVSAVRKKVISTGQTIDLNAPHNQLYLYSSLSSAGDSNADHNGIHRDPRIQSLIAFLLGVGPEPVIDFNFEDSGSVATAQTGSNLREDNHKSGPKSNSGNAGVAAVNGMSSDNALSKFTGSRMPSTDLSNFSPSYYVSIIGQSDVTVRDAQGNTAAVENQILTNNVKGLRNFRMIGENSLLLTMSADQVYTAEFKAVERSMGIELLVGKGNQNPSSVLRWNDLNIPGNVNVRLTVSNATDSKLEYDSDGDGQFESAVPPTVVLTGVGANDFTPPIVSINVVQQGNFATSSISAQDSQSGVGRIIYSLDGINFRVYTSAFTIPYNTNPVKISAFADDLAGNRSNIFQRTFTFSQARANIRHGFTLNGRIDGPIQQILGENTVFNSSAILSGDFFVPGSPTLIRNGNSTFGGIIGGSGSSQPSNYSITLNGGSQVGHILTRTDPVNLPTVAPPPSPQGTRNVTISNPGQSIGDFTSLRNLTLNTGAGTRVIPPGNYGSFIVNSGSGIILGVADSPLPVVYNLSGLTLNSGSQVQVIGPVILTVGGSLSSNSVIGTSNHPNWLQVKVASGGFTVNSGSTLYGNVLVPLGTATINGTLIGNVTADRLIVNGSGLLQITGP